MIEMTYKEVSSKFKKKKVFITGNTGFKGVWLTMMLLDMGALVTGFSKPEGVAKQPQLFSSNREGFWQEEGDIRDLHTLSTLLHKNKPDYVFHLAANAITLASYEQPIDTFQVNVIGTANVLEAARLCKFPCKVIVVSSDKCYQNNHWVWGYRESDTLGGIDPYSASKSMAEMVMSAYYHSFFKSNSNISVASVRAGNVIGGGDWGKDRIIPDAVRAWKRKRPLEIRNPHHTRPWSYVLDVLWGYLLVACNLDKDSFNGEAFNFGAEISQAVTVEHLVKSFWSHWTDKSFDPFFFSNPISPQNHEHEVLLLNTDKARKLLRWQPVFSLNAALKETAFWYENEELFKKQPAELAEILLNNYISRLSDISS
jgi:CDP-glucose 4,6-dehydratase